jgi:hypothetical protein
LSNTELDTAELTEYESEIGVVEPHWVTEPVPARGKLGLYWTTAVTDPGHDHGAR